MQFDFMPEKRTIDAVFILRRLEEECHSKWKKLYMCFVDLEKAFESTKESVGMGNEEGRERISLG